MELEQLQQANEKLTARLNKAVEVFKEQKANIDSLTAQVKAAESEKENAINLFKEVDKQVGELRIENEQLKKKLEESEAAVNISGEIEKQIQVAKQEYSELSEKYNEAVKTSLELSAENANIAAEKAKLESDFENISADLQAAINCNERNNKEFAVATEKITELENALKLATDTAAQRELENKTLEEKYNEYGLKLKNSDAAYEELRKKYVDAQTTYTEELSQYQNLLKKFINDASKLVTVEKKHTQQTTGVKEVNNFVSDATEFNM